MKPLKAAVKIACLLLLSALPAVVNAQLSFMTNNGTYYYTIDNSSITIIEYNGPGPALTIPNTISGLPVTSIGDNAFDSSIQLTSITIPDNVTNIEPNAFYWCTSLTNFTIGNSVISIGGTAFYGCSSLTSFTIPNNVAGIGVGAFYDCTGLTNVTIGNGVTDIESNAFYGCTSLTAIKVDTNNPVYCSLAGVLFDKSQTTLIQFPGGNAGGYTVPNSVTNIEDNAFYGCNSLTNVTIGNSVTSIGRQALASCTSLTAITVDTNNLDYSSVAGALFDRSQTILIQCPGGKAGSYSVPNSVISIGAYAFYGCSSLTSVTIGDSVTSIGDNSFYGFSSLTNVTIGNSVTSIGDSAFYACSSLTSVTIPNSVTSIGDSAFYACSSLTNVTIDNGVTSIGDNAFSYCSSLTSVMIGNSVTSIGIWAFISCTSLTNVMIPDSVTSIGDGAFELCTSLTTVTIGNNITNIGNYVFANKSGGSLTGVYFRGNAPVSGSFGFSGDNNATVYYLPGTTGWGPSFSGAQTAFWFLPNPLILNNNSSFGVQTNGFGFIISWATNVSVVVEACTNLANPFWSPVATNTLTGGSSYFSDSEWMNHRARFYRLSSP